MSGFLTSLESSIDGQSGNSAQASDNYSGGNTDQASGSDNLNAAQGGNYQDQSSQQSSSDDSQRSGGNSFLSGAKTAGEDAMVDQEVNSFMTKEGVPAGADGFVDNEVNQEAQKFL